MPKNPQANDYQISVDRVIEPGQVTADQKNRDPGDGRQCAPAAGARASGRASPRGRHHGRLAEDGREAGVEIGPPWCGMPKKGPRTGARGRAETVC